MRGGQSSMEYLIIVGIALGLLIPAVFFFLQYNKSQEAVGVGGQINEIGLSMVTAAADAYSLGFGARRQIEVSLPQGIRRVWVNGTELSIRYETQLGVADAVFFSTVPLNTSYPDGNVSFAHGGAATFRFVSLGTSVNVTEVLE